MSTTISARNYAAGKWLDSPRVATSIGPATGEELGTFADGGAEEAQLSVDAAHHAFTESDWSRDRHLRAAVLHEIADELERRQDEVIRLLSVENGKIIGEATLEVAMSLSKLRYYAALALSDLGSAGEIRPQLYSMSLRQPMGVAGIIVPWNSPLVLSVRSFAPAFAAGCTIAMKMPGQTGLFNGLLYEIVTACPSLPPGVFNAFTETRNEGAPLLISDKRVRIVSYTGSTGVGRAIMRQAAENLTPVTLELGGKTPMIVFDDADIDALVPVLTKGVTVMAGQFCMAGSRILAQSSIADVLRARLAESFSSVRVGPGDDAGSDMGPMIDTGNVRRLDKIVEDSLSYAKPVVRGGVPTDPEFAGGAYYRPALIEVDSVDCELVQNELFGPVATFEVFETEADAIALANATDFGLAASIWSRDVDRPIRVARELESGTVWINTWALVSDQFEEGGFKHSGVGRLNGRRGLEEFQEIKTIVHPIKAV